MRFALLVVAACAATPAPALTNEKPDRPRAFEVPLAPARWALSASATFANDAIAFRYCCRNWGKATTTIAMPAGAWWIGITHASDCTRAMGAIVRAPNREPLVAVGGIWGQRVGIVQVEIDDELANAELQLEIYAEGGLRCCGGTTVSKIEVIPI